MTAPEFERRLVLAFGPITPAELRAELAALAVVDNHRQAVADACAGRPRRLVDLADGLAMGTADYTPRRGGR